MKTANDVYGYFVLDDTDMTFHWSTSITQGQQNVTILFPNAEGIDTHKQILNFISKEMKELITLDLAAQT